MDRESIDRRIKSEKEIYTDGMEGREGYSTNLTGRRQQSWFAESSCHQTIFAADAFAPGENVRVNMVTIHAGDRQAGVNRFLSAYHNHDFFEMLYVYRGVCTTTVEGEARQLGEGSVCIYDWEAVHQIGIEDERSVVFNILMKRELFDSAFLQLMGDSHPVSAFFMRSLYSVPSPARHMVFALTEEGRGYADRIVAEYLEKRSMYKNMMYASLLALFISLSRQYRSMVEDKSYEDSSLDICEVLSYMALHYRDITMEELSARFHYAPRTLMRLLRRYTNRTFGEIITEFRMQEACRLLRDGVRVEEAASQAGYADRGYFDKVFKLHFHMTPAKYRRDAAGWF